MKPTISKKTQEYLAALEQNNPTSRITTTEIRMRLTDLSTRMDYVWPDVDEDLSLRGFLEEELLRVAKPVGVAS